MWNRLWKKIKQPQHLRQQLGGLVLICLAFFAQPVNPPLLYSGLILSLGGLIGRIYCSGFLVKNDELTTEGPYGYVRNPIYVSNYVLGAGVSLLSGVLIQGLIALAVLYFAAYLPGMKTEAENLRKRFGGRFEAWERAVPLILPSLTPVSGFGGGKWQTAAYLKNREQYITTGVGVIISWLLYINVR